MQILKKCILILLLLFVIHSSAFGQSDRWIYVGTANHHNVTIYYDSEGINRYTENSSSGTTENIIEVWIKYVYAKPCVDYTNREQKFQPFSFIEFRELVSFNETNKRIFTPKDYEFVGEKGNHITWESRPTWLNYVTNRIYPFTIYEKVFEFIKER